MKNVAQLRDELSNIWNGLKDGSIEPKKAAEFSNIAGKMINSSKVQIEYMALTKSKKKVPFLESEDTDAKAG